MQADGPLTLPPCDDFKAMAELNKNELRHVDIREERIWMDSLLLSRL